MSTDDAPESPPPLPDVLLAFDVDAEVEPVDHIAYETYEAQSRLWLRSIVGLLQSTSTESDPNPRVQFALDRMRIAACERAARLLSSDVVGPTD